MTKKKIIIAGSAKLQGEIKEWIDYWEEKGCVVVDFPRSIPKDTFDKTYPGVHKKFYADILKADIFFVANGKKNGIMGYIGPETFAELAFAVIRKISNKQKIKIILARMPSKKVASHEEIKRWLRLGWIDEILRK